MAQLLFVVLIILASIGAYRCQGEDKTVEYQPATRLQQYQQTPGRVEQEVNSQVDEINKRNQEILNRY